MAQVIIVGGGLAGLSAAHTALERGANCIVLDKKPFCGGNSTKATSGINGAGTATQRAKGVNDNVEIFYEDMKRSARHLFRPNLVEVMANDSAPGVEWLIKKFGLDLSLVSRLGGHSEERTHRGKERFPGMTITYALMEKYEELCKAHPDRCRLLNRACVTDLIVENNEVVGVHYSHNGQTKTERGAVVIASGGFGADFSEDGLLNAYRPDVLPLATTNGDHCTGDGMKMGQKVGANLVDMKMVQVHPTGLVDPNDPAAKVKFLAAEALRGVGALLLNAKGERFVDELGHRDHVTAEIRKTPNPPQGGAWLVLNGAAAREINWHVAHYSGRGIMKKDLSADQLAKHMGVSVAQLDNTFKTYNEVARTKKCPYGKKFFHNTPWSVNDKFAVALITPLVHYTMGGLEVEADTAVVGKNGVIPGLWAAGEVMGGVHGANRLGGNSLMDCVVFGRVAGASAATHLLHKIASGKLAAGGSGNANGVSVTVSSGGVDVKVSFNGGAASAPAAAAAEAPTAPEAAAPAAAAPDRNKVYTPEEVAKHNKEDDCWVIVNGEVLDVTSFLDDHPGGKKPIMIFAGRDASAEFNMLHKPDVVEKYAPEVIIGKISTPNAKL
mmetsp:Transcript_4836/g.13537  ORF Transcript_4836/g.13537 Transcript_4836/m.13537 type:complete len:610 (+) Transcript_4836:55-1884(+)